MLNKLLLNNWKSHTNSAYEFTQGVNIITGPMGAGKSSIFQAITFALFGSLPEIKSRDVKTTELVNRDPRAEETQIKLLFSCGQEFAIHRSIHKKDGTGNATVRNEQDQLAAGPKPTAATSFINELLKTDLDTFLRTVYAKQNEIDLFLKYSPADRKKYIDELMKLDKFELARKHSTQLQNKIKVRLDESQKLLETTDAETLTNQITQLSQELSNLDNQKKTASQHIEKAHNNEQVLKQKLNALREKKSLVDGLQQNLQLLTNQIEQLKTKLKDAHLEASKQEILSRIQALQNQLLNLKTEKTKIQQASDPIESQIIALERQLAVLISKENELKNRQNELNRLNDEANRIDMQRPSLATDLELNKTKKESLTEELANRNAEVNSIIEHHAELKQAGSVCPICTTKLTPETKQKLIEKRTKQIIDLNKTKSELSTKLETVKKELEELEEMYKKRTGLAERLTEVRKVCEELTSEIVEKPGVENKKTELENQIINIKNQVKNIENQVEVIQNRTNQLTEQKSLYDAKDQLENLKRQQTETQSKLSELSFDHVVLTNTENQYASALQKVQELISQQQNIGAIINEKDKRKSELLDQQVKLARLSETISQCASKIEFLTQFNNALLTTQEALRIDLISTVNEVMSSIWTDIYPYDKWTDIRLLASEADYVLQILDENSEYFSVAGFASGGERMLAALALRIAFAKVLAPHLSLLILDEPTHNLDQKAIDTFLEILQGKLANYLDQIFIITHDPKLAEAGNIIDI